MLQNCDVDGFDGSAKFSSIKHLFRHVDNKWDCLNVGASWRNQFMNFDNVLHSMASLFIMSNSVQWSQMMYTAAKIRERD
jgi:hypothetical protein